MKPCPVNSHPGMWEIPLVQHVGGTKLGSACSMIDSCNDRGTRDSARDMLLDNFMRHYTSNRAPFPLFMHAWFDKGNYRCVRVCVTFWFHSCSPFVFRICLPLGFFLFFRFSVFFLFYNFTLSFNPVLIVFVPVVIIFPFCFLPCSV